MTQSEFHQSIARATGESRSTIRRRGFSPLNFDLPEDEPVEPSVYNWDEQQATTLSRMAA